MELKIRGNALTLFWNRVVITDSCWLYTGRLDREGYGAVYGFGEKPDVPEGAHRVVFALYAGRLPCGKVLHTCDVRNCVLEDHLYEGTQARNMEDMRTRGRASYSSVQKISAAQVEEIRARYTDGAGILLLAREYHVSTTTIYKKLGRPGY